MKFHLTFQKLEACKKLFDFSQLFHPIKEYAKQTTVREKIVRA